MSVETKKKYQTKVSSIWHSIKEEKSDRKDAPVGNIQAFLSKFDKNDRIYSVSVP